MESISVQHIEQLKVAKSALESADLAVRMASIIGTPIEKAIDLLPGRWQEIILDVSRDALEKAADAAIWTLTGEVPAARNLSHKLAVAVAGAAAGTFGLPALAIELPISTTIMLRSIADIARSEGEDIRTAEARLACIEVFALGGRAQSDDAAESGYYAARAVLGQVVSEAAGYLAKGGAQTTAPAIVRFISRVAARFQIQVTEKAAAQAAPILGAAGGALINSIFISHFQKMARAHFTVRRLERTYSPQLVEARYREL
jgi:hypothetical protein